MTLSATLIGLSEKFRRPSNIGRLDACNAQAFMAAWMLMEEGEPPSAPEADLGKTIHKHVEFHAQAIAYGSTLEYCLEWMQNNAPTRALDSWSQHCIRTTLEFYVALIQKYNIAPENILVEHQLDMAATGFNRKGTADLVLVVPFEFVVIVDLKAGFVDQGDTEDHDQLAVYAAAAAETFKAKKVIVWMYQPRAERERRATAAEFDADTLRATVGWSRAVLERSRDPHAQLTAAFNQCSTCPALRRCPKAKEYIMDAQEAISVMGNPTDAAAWGNAIGAAKLAEKWSDAWKEKGKEHLMAGGKADGFALGAARATRSVTDPGMALSMLENAGITPASLALSDALTFKVAQLPPAAAEVIKDLITSKPSLPSLVADKRSKVAA